ncbi:MAG: hypothetical protein K6T91_11230 [Firmicutes bacterium]|nr:hypothetical protein [Bacillota bacterium]
MAKRLLFIIFAIIYFFVSPGFALAGQGQKTDGSIYWTYADSADSSPKTEGGYAPFSDSGGDPSAGSKYTSNPHGGYGAYGKKCSICHASHRSEGAYFLLRADSRDDACIYCHVGGSSRSNKIVYRLSPNGILTKNGHTIGASATIPDSSVYQWLSNKTITSIDGNGNTIQETIQIRSYDSTANKMFRFARHHGQNVAGSNREGYLRIGPLALGCTSCHQPHGATNTIWRPTSLETGAKLLEGYKLLKLSPSGSIWGSATFSDNAGNTWTEDYDEGMRTWKAYGEFDVNNQKVYVNANNIITVPETTMTAANTGNDGVFPNTIYTKFEGVTDPTQMRGSVRDPQTINQYALSAWCADCHNLDIGYWKGLANTELGYKNHADRTHPVPFTGANNGPGQCYSCHRNDLPADPIYSYYDSENVSCEACHFGTSTYKAVREDINGDGIAGDYSDFPHSGQENSIKLLGSYVGFLDDSGNRQTKEQTITEDNLDGVCKRCHTGIGVNH